jgi:peptidoglycan-associated lipoprotein
MRRLVLTFASLTAMALAGCPKPPPGTCKTSEDCKEQTGYGKVCVQGQCQECGADTDCKAGFACKANKCQPRPECESPGDCAAGKTCQDGKCISSWVPGTCDAEHACPSDQDCMGGRCIAKPKEPVKGPCDDLASVYFAFDKAELDEASRMALAHLAERLAGEPGRRVRIEGNCDERGTSEYNLALGQRRADVAKSYLVNLGVSVDAIETLSWGKERPKMLGHDEEAWRFNRRADFYVSAPLEVSAR